jgi:predicted dehydrogenase
MGIKVGICGTGAFSSCFIPLFKAHPAVDSVVLSDLDTGKLARQAERFDLPHTCPSLDELCQSDVDAIAIFSQNTLHGPQAVQALRSGKHVYSAVPSAITLEEMTELLRAVEETGQIYMIGETSYYYPSAIYCRERFHKGDFGTAVYSEAEYYHDMDTLYAVMKNRFGNDWKKFAGSPPMLYPTHSTALVVSVTGAHVTHVSGMGYADRDDDGLFREGVNIWNNVFSNETALCRMSDGSVCRLNEFRRISAAGERMRLYGTLGSFEEQSGDRCQWVGKDGIVDLSELLACEEFTPDGLHSSLAQLKGDAMHHGASAIHQIADLPREFEGLPNGHKGSHQWLVHEFVTSCINHTQPANNVWQAARDLIPGLIAHQSAMRNSELLEVPDFGDAPA